MPQPIRIQQFLNLYRPLMHPLHKLQKVFEIGGGQIEVMMNCRAGGGCGRGSSPPATRTQEYHPGKFWKVHVQNGAFRGKIALYSNSKGSAIFA